MVKHSPQPTGHSASQETDLKMKALLSSETVWTTHPTTQPHIPAPLSELWVLMIRLISQSNPLCGHINLHCVSSTHDFYAYQEIETKMLSTGRKHLPQACYLIREGYLCAIVDDKQVQTCRGKWEIRVRCFVASLQNLTVSVSFMCVKFDLLHYGKNNTEDVWE